MTHIFLGPLNHRRKDNLRETGILWRNAPLWLTVNFTIASKSGHSKPSTTAATRNAVPQRRLSRGRQFQKVRRYRFLSLRVCLRPSSRRQTRFDHGL